MTLDSLAVPAAPRSPRDAAFLVAPFLLSTAAIFGLAGCTEPPQQPQGRAEPAAPRSISAPLMRFGAKTPQQVALARAPDASDQFFAEKKVVELRLKIDEPQVTQLREEPRSYVRAALVENGRTTYPDVAVKLKGAAGSFQNFDDRPALTINMNKFREGQTFHAIDKFHLNNSVQDDTYACEAICSELSRADGLPATRVSHARVWLNDRDMGLYVFKEGFDKAFLKRHFEKGDGNLYDGGFLRDVDMDLEKDLGKGPDDFSDLRALAAACREPNPRKRWALLENQLDVDLFVRFMALELMTCHWDGYTKNRNNYRIYFDPSDGKARFLPHGMDQMFSDPGFSVLDAPEPIVSAAVMQNPAWRKLYRQRLEKLLPIYSADNLVKRLDAVRDKLQPVLAAISQDADRNHAERCRELRERLVARAANLREQVRQRDPGPVEFDDQGRLALEDWEPRQETEDSKLERVESEGRFEYVIETGPSGRCVASWRCKVMLAQGTYRLEAKIKTAGVAAGSDDKGRGAGVRISGGAREQGVTGDANWTDVAQQFTVAEPLREVELVAELRATSGRATFQAPLRLVRVTPSP